MDTFLIQSVIFCLDSVIASILQTYNDAKGRKMDNWTWTLPMQHISQNMICFLLKMIDCFYIVPFWFFKSVFCECNVKVLLRGLYNQDCPLSKLKMDKEKIDKI